jgi:hypothetical protein
MDPNILINYLKKMAGQAKSSVDKINQVNQSVGDFMTKTPVLGDVVRTGQGILKTAYDQSQEAYKPEKAVERIKNEITNYDPRNVDENMSLMMGLSTGINPVNREMGILDKFGNPIKEAPISEATHLKVDATGNLVENKNFIPRQETIKAPSVPNEPYVANPQMDIPDPQTKPLPKIPSQKPLSGVQKTAQKLNGIDNYQLDPTKYGANTKMFEDFDKSVIQNEIGANTTGEVVDKIAQAKQKVWDHAVSVAKQADSVSVPLSIDKDVMPYVREEIQKLANNRIIDPSQIGTEIENARRSILSSVDKSSITSGQVPIGESGVITREQLLAAKTAANQTNLAYNGAGDILPNAAVGRQVNTAIRNGLDHSVTQVIPEIKADTLKLSSMERIMENMPNQLRNQSLTVGVNVLGKHLPVIPGSGTVRKVLASALSGNPKAYLPLLGGAYLGAKALAGNEKVKNFVNDTVQKGKDYIANQAGYVRNTKDQIPNNDSSNQAPPPASSVAPQQSEVKIPKSTNDINPDKNGYYSVVSAKSFKDATGNPVAVSGNELDKQAALNTKKINDLNAKILYDGNPQLVKDLANAQTEQSILQNKKTISDTLNEAEAKAVNFTDAANQLIYLLPKAPIGLWNSNKTLKQLIQENDPSYAPYLQVLSKLDQINPGSIDVLFQSANKDGAKAALDTLIKNFLFSYSTLGIGKYLGNESSDATGDVESPPVYKTNISPNLPQYAPENTIPQSSGGTVHGTPVPIPDGNVFGGGGGLPPITGKTDKKKTSLPVIPKRYEYR